MRVARAAVALSILLVTNSVGNYGQCSVAVGAVLVLLRESLYVVGMARGAVGLLKIVVVVERMFRMTIAMGLWFAVRHLLCPHSSGLLGLAAGNLSVQSEATVRVEENRVIISTNVPAVLSLNMVCEADEQLAMVLCRLLCSSQGKHLLTHQEIATAFGKKDRRDCSNLHGTRQAGPDGSGSRTGLALLQVLKKLFAPLAAEDDENLAANLGGANVASLHYGVLYCVLRLSISAHIHFSGVLSLDEKWVKIPKSFTKEQRDGGKKWRYVFFAVDALTGDILHIDVFDSSKADNIRVFLAAIRAKGIKPKVLVTDMLAAYDNAIRETFGNRVVHHYCLFHHLQAVRHRLRDRCGNDWKSRPLLREFVQKVDRVYKCKDQRTAKRRLAGLLPADAYD